MGTISLTLPADGQSIDASDVNTPFNTISTVINGNLDSNNLLPGGVTPASLTSGAGSSWAWITASAPTITAVSGTITTSSATCKYVQIGKSILFRMNITITTNGSGAGAVVATLPITSSAINMSVGSGRASAVSGKQLQAYTSATNTINIYNYDGTYPGASGELLLINGFFEIP